MHPTLLAQHYICRAGIIMSTELHGCERRPSDEGLARCMNSLQDEYLSEAVVPLQDTEMEIAEAAPSAADQMRQDVLRLLERLPQDALQPSLWAPATELAWHTLLTSSTVPQVTFAWLCSSSNHAS